MVLGATALWGINGSFAKAALSSGLSSLRLTEVRSTGAALILVGALAIARPRSLRIRRGELPFLLLFGVAGLAFVQLLYFVAIHRLEIGVALLIQYVAPVLIALWARLVLKEPVRRRVWAALILSLGGLSFVVDLWSGVALDGLGVLAALGSAVAFALYILLAENAVTRRDPVSLLALGFTFAALFWALRPTVVVVPDGVSGRPSQPRRRRLLHHAAGLGAPDRRRPRRHDRAVPAAPRSASPPLGDPGRRDRDVRAGCGRARRLRAARRVVDRGCSSWAARSSSRAFCSPKRRAERKFLRRKSVRTSRKLLKIAVVNLDDIFFAH